MNESKTTTEKIWSFFSSIKLSVFLFAAIALSSAIGTIIEQNAAPEKNIIIISKIFGTSLSRKLFLIFEKLGFTDIYDSTLFLLLIALFAINLIVCSINRLPRIIKLVRDPIKPLSEIEFQDSVNKKEFVLQCGPDTAKDLIAHSFNKIGFRFKTVEEPSGRQMFSEKGKYSRLGVYITHLSILLILAGALIGKSFGFKGFINIPEGRAYSFVFTVSKAFDNNEKAKIEKTTKKIEETQGNLTEAANQLGISLNELENKMKTYGIHPLGFSVRCDNFISEFYEGTFIPQKYASELTIIENNKETLRKTITVNDPLTYKGITFYQSNYGMLPDEEGKLIFKITSKSGDSKIVELKPGKSFLIPGTDMQGAPLYFSPAIAFDEKGIPFQISKDQMVNPAVYMEFSEKGKRKYGGWLLKKFPDTGKLPDGQLVEFLDYWGIEYTGLQARKDPGIGIFYFGCALMAAGLFSAFFLSHKKLWIRLINENGRTHIDFIINSNKNLKALEMKVEKIIDNLKKSQEGKAS